MCDWRELRLLLLFVKKNVLIILPTYNEAENIGLMLDELIYLSKKHNGYKIDILVVDDRSPDGTGRIVKDYQKTNKNILLASGRKSGLGDAYIRGMKYGIRLKKYFAFVMMDADFSHDPKVIPELLNELSLGRDCVIGSRYTRGGFIPGNWPILRILNSKIANFLARLFIGFDSSITDLTGGFKAIKVESLQRLDLDNINASGYFFQVSLLYALIEQEFRISEIPISFSDRIRGNSKISKSDVLEFIRKAYSLNPNSRVRRITTFAMVGTLGTLVNLITLSLLLKLIHLDPIIADALAIEVSIISNFYLNNKYTFRSGLSTQSIKSQLSDFWKFNAGALAGALISLFIFTVLYKLVGVNYVVADLIAIAMSVSWNYWISVRFVWKVENAIS